MRSASKNICSVRDRPIPSAPKSRAVLASSGVSALVRTFIVRTASAQPIKVPKSPDNFGWIVGTSPSITSPVEPFRVSTSPRVHQMVAHRQRAGGVIYTQIAGA